MTTSEPLKALAEAATPEVILTERILYEPTVCGDVLLAKFQHHKDAKFYAAANPAAVLAMLELIEKQQKALELAEKWLLNCVPTSNIEGPKPLPVIREALAAHEKWEGGV